MKTPNTKTIALDTLGPDDEDHELRALITVDLDEEDAPPRQRTVDEFSDEFLMQAPKGPKPAG
ncbi:hypothetical protein [Massilia sp. TWR1-2-2]|uniref:hypothetical protein n=1 Tax=Massilia sp. TWR1-2-2 TaxID=2804584 RepID=UPI003CF683D9